MQNSFFKKLFESFVSKTFFGLVGIIASAVTIYAFIENKKVDLRYEIIANTNVLDFNADVNKLEVIYDSTNLKETQENLRIFTIKIVNNGEKDITKDLYDDNDPIGIKISTGKIIECPELIKTSSDYLSRNLKLVDYTKGNIKFSPVILESGEYFIVKLLVLHKKDSIPEIISFGKVAGQKQIEVVNAIDIKKQLSFWGETYQGNFLVQILRLISYFLVVVIIIGIIVGITEIIDTQRERARKIKLITDFKKIESYEYTRMDDAIFDRYQQDGLMYYDEMIALLKDEAELNNVYIKLSEGLKSKEFRRFRKIDDSSNNSLINEDSWHIINEMISDGIIFKDQEKLSINLAMKETLNKFIVFLKDKRGVRRKYKPISIEDLNIKDTETDSN